MKLRILSLLFGCLCMVIFPCFSGVICAKKSKNTSSSTAVKIGKPKEVKVKKRNLDKVKSTEKIHNSAKGDKLFKVAILTAPILGLAGVAVSCVGGMFADNESVSNVLKGVSIAMCSTSVLTIGGVAIAVFSSILGSMKALS